MRYKIIWQSQLENEHYSIVYFNCVIAFGGVKHALYIVAVDSCCNNLHSTFESPPLTEVQRYCISKRSDAIPGLGDSKYRSPEIRELINVVDTEKELAREVKAARRVKYKEHDRVPGLEVQRGCTMSSVSWIPVVPSLIACRTRTRAKINEGAL